MKILHFSDVGLPDARVERPAIFSKHQGWEVVFAGGRSSQTQIFGAFDTIHYRYWKSWEKTGFPGTLQQVRNWLRRLIRTEDPDLIHAHDIFAAKVARDIGHPFVYDDHEIWGSRISYQGSQVVKRNRTLLRRIATWFAIRNWRKWESEIFKAAPVITVSEEIAQLYRRIQPQVFAIPNLPLKREVALIPPNKNIDEVFRVAYVSRHSLPLEQRRDTIALTLWLQNRFNATLVFLGPTIIETEEVENHGYVSHKKMLEILSTCDIALMGQKTRLPVYSYQNRFPLFLHAGLKTIVPDSKINEVKFCETHKVGWSWGSADNLKAVLRQRVSEYHENIDRWNHDKTRVREIAQKYLLWNYFGNTLKEAYEMALEMN
ncbi:MAG: glycosyltransferase [Candidatus Hermodarchaeota archaeon]|nr:glycosyltransferase [Candidatus Hermodarchaeota archaeon]